MRHLSYLASALVLIAAAPTVASAQKAKADGCTSYEAFTQSKSGSITFGELTAGYYGIAYGGIIGGYDGKPGWADYPVVRAVFCGSPAATAGVAVGDVILSVNGQDARKPGVLAAKEPGMVFRLRIRRSGNVLAFVLKTVQRPSGS